MPLEKNLNVADLPESAFAEGKPSLSSRLGLVFRGSTSPGNKTGYRKDSKTCDFSPNRSVFAVITSNIQCGLAQE